MKIAVLVSGGVDSALALSLLVEEGHDVTAFYLKIWLEDDQQFLGECPWEEDLRYVRAVCEQHQVSLEIIPLQRQYHARVVTHAVAELSAGRTPSPDIHCNAEIKFGAFFDAVEDFSQRFDAVASGHYAQSTRRDGSWRLLRAPDPVKDQTYFLSQLTQAQLSRLRFPIGHLQKAQVRREAEARALAPCERKDSQGICFLGKVKYPDFVRSYLGDRPGDIVDVDTGAVLGRHLGVWYHTIGQRRGLGLGGGPWFVVGKDVSGGRILVSHQERYAAHKRDSFQVTDVHWIAQVPVDGARVQAKLRHGPAHCEARLSHLAPRPSQPDHAGEGEGAKQAERWQVELQLPDQGVAPGQSAVFYQGDECLGRGVIV